LRVGDAFPFCLGEAAVCSAVVEAAKKAQASAMTKMKQVMMEMQQELAVSLKNSAPPQ